jgi:hypothetical protein
MKTSKLRKFAWVFFALALTTTTVFSQGWRNANRANRTNNTTEQNCLNYLSDLTDEQVVKIEKLETSHQEKMDELRNQRRSTTDLNEKNEIRAEMLNKVAAHQKEVKNLLTAEQQKEYDWLHSQGSRFKNQRTANTGNRGWAQGRGNQQNVSRRGSCGNFGQGRQGMGRGNNCNQKGRKGRGNSRNFQGKGNFSNS